ncbi:hypothetical protein Gotri_003438 [Gossypium trilobum]|uniref:RNase H type-1 domain-containing protein n=1 Tax=Gossypium trilobum TaxID=34281 RepID=A0A7J9F1H6_9ROSI|nr:hypothetical protein [Gossypium trilobum]
MQHETRFGNSLPSNWVHLSTDGAIKTDSVTTFAGDILDGLVLLQGHGYQWVTIQSDCLEVVLVLQDTPSATSSSALIKCI